MVIFPTMCKEKKGEEQIRDEGCFFFFYRHGLDFYSDTDFSSDFDTQYSYSSVRDTRTDKPTD